MLGLGNKKVLIVDAHTGSKMSKLAEGAVAELKSANIEYKIITVPTVSEIPLVIRYATRAMEMRATEDYYSGYIVLGHARESNPNDDVALQGIQDIAMQLSLALGYGILFWEGHEQEGTTAAKKCLHMIKVKGELGL